MIVVSCKAPYGGGGLGQHVAQVIEEAREAGGLARYYVNAPRPGDPLGVEVHSRLRPLVRYTPLRYSKRAQDLLSSEGFDLAVAARLGEPVEAFVGFSGQALRSFRRARTVGTERLELHVPTVHLRLAARRYAAATRQYGVEKGWLSGWLVQKALREYEAADRIVVNSEYVRASFLAEGVPAEKLRRIHLRVDPRFRPGPRPNDGVFRVAYVGGLSVAKGTPVLIEAFVRLADPDAELTLVGTVSTRAMRRYLEAWQRRDPRIRVASGDPLPVLRRTDVYVHPSYQDGYGYAPMEALACGVPVIVTEDTGMKEHVHEGVNGFVVPTGSPDAIFARLEHLRAHPLPNPSPAPAHDAR